MNENSLEKHRIEEEIKQADRIPLEYRNPFQVEVLKMLIAEKILDKKDMDEVKRYGKIISDFIDNHENIEVRNLIVQKKFEEAAEIMVAEIRKETSLKEAA